MSRMLDISDAIRARLEAQGRLAGVAIIVDRQKNIATGVAKAVGKAGGNAVTILWEGFTVPDANTSGPRILSRYTLRTWSMPVIEDATKAPEDVLYADELLQVIVKALHHWIPEGTHSFGEFTVTGGDFVHDQRWLCYEASGEIQLTL